MVSALTPHAYRLARNLFRVLQCSKKLMEEESGPAEDHSQHTEDPAKSHILGKCYERKTRFRYPCIPAKLCQVDGGHLCGIYNTLKCSDIHELDLHSMTTFPPITPGSLQLTGPLPGSSGDDYGSHSKAEEAKPGQGNNVELPKFEHTEISLLPMIRQNLRKATVAATSR